MTTITQTLNEKMAAVETAKASLKVHTEGGIAENITAAKKKLHAACEALRRFKAKTGAATDAEVKAHDAEVKATEAKFEAAATPAPVVEVVAAPVEAVAAPVAPAVEAVVAALSTLRKAAKAAPAAKPAKVAKPAKAKVVVEAKPTSTKTYRDLARFISLAFAVSAEEVASFLGLDAMPKDDAKNIARRACDAVGACWTTTNSGTFAQLFEDGQEEAGEAFKNNMAQAEKACGEKFNTLIPVDVRNGSHPVHPRCPHCGKPMYKSMNPGKVFKTDMWAFCRNIRCTKWNVAQAAARPELFLTAEKKAELIKAAGIAAAA